MMKYPVTIILMIAAFSCAPAPVDEIPDVRFLNSPATENLNFPFSEAVRVGNTLYLSGQIGNIPGRRELVAGGVEAEARQTLDNIRATLERFGAGLDDVVKCTVFLADIGEWPKFNDVYMEYFRKPYPARSAVAGSGLALGARVEVECIAVIR